MSRERCPRCGEATESVAGVHVRPGEPMVRCRACGWSSAEPAPGWGGFGWLLWFGLGVVPALVAPLVFGLGSMWDLRDAAAFVVVVGGIACCCVGGFGLASALVRQPLNRLVLGLVATGGLGLLNLTIGLVAICGRS